MSSNEMDTKTRTTVQDQRLHDREVEQSLFAKREKIYPREVHGLFAGLRLTAVIVLLAVYYGLPWLEWDGRQAVLFDLPARKFYIFGLTLWPQDFLILAFLLIIAAVSLFFFTALAGRLWCGYACPQTIWTELFIWVERAVEGDRPHQIRLDKLPRWSPERLRAKVLKHTVWILIAWFTGFTFVAYFTPAETLVNNMMDFNLGSWESFWIIFYSFATYGNAGWMREQVCTYMCPYARFQSAMFDDNTLIVSYDGNRGEPRGSRRASEDYKSRGLGDCIDCTICVQVCPTGIDIRDGLQYKCISCSSCIDACNDVMDKMGYAPGLIRFTTQNNLQGKPTRFFRPRIIVYGGILLTLMALFAFTLVSRVPVGLDAIRDRNQLFREAGDFIENVYTLKIINMDTIDHDYSIKAEGIEDLQLSLDTDPVAVKSGQVYNLPVTLRTEEKNLMARSNDVIFSISAVDDPGIRTTERNKFLGPVE